MTNYTREFLIRMSWLTTWLMVLLVVIAVWFNKASHENANDSVFHPVHRINQLKEMQSAMDNASAEPINTSPIDCKDRGLSILTIRTMDGFGIDAATASSTLQKINQHLGFKLRCSEWLENTEYLANYKRKRSRDLHAIGIDSTLSEQVSWTRQLPCVFFHLNNRDELLMGNPIRCARRTKDINQPPIAAAGSFLDMMNVSKEFMLNSIQPEVQGMKGTDYLITLDSKLQEMMDQWADCLTKKFCASSPQLSNSRQVSAVIVDVQTGDLLAALCWSGACSKPEMKQLSQLGALLVEAPPASTAKLLHSMVLAQNPQINPLMLQRQLKTSGQTDAFVTKRNEWWEKQAICDDSVKIPCRHPSLVDAMALQFKWNQNCTGNPIFCGRNSVVEDSNSLVMSGLIGHIVTSSKPQKSIPLMKWSDYDSVRQGKSKSDGSVTYLNTAISVQSVIGGGDNRTSALGLANISLQIARLSAGHGVRTPLLIRPLHSPVDTPAPGAMTAAAKVVLGGMRKVVEPAEPGWKDPGTVAITLERIFGKACTSECGIWAKTGTVSSQDPNFAGTTLFSSVIDLNQIHNWRYNIENKREGRKLALGVIVAPIKGVKPTHLASELGIQFAYQFSELEEHP